MKFYRGTRDILPQYLNHRKLRDAVYGEATYFALNFEDARRYSSGGYGFCAIVVTYEIDLKNTLYIADNDWEDISCISNASKPRMISDSLKLQLKLQENQLKPKDLSVIASNAQYDSVILKGNFEGGEQLILPKNDTDPSPIAFDIFIGLELLGRNSEGTQKELFIEALSNFGIKASDEYYMIHIAVTAIQLQKILPLMNFLEYCRSTSFRSIDYNNLTAEEFDYE